MLHGWLALNKPAGVTSNYVLHSVKRRFPKGQKLGFAGTLDPFATGMLPIALGEATKVIPFLYDDTKSYDLTIAWGAQTDSDDIDGAITATSDHRPTQQEIEALLPEFLGDIEQTPPNFSAIKVEGKRAYELARKDQEISLKSRIVQIHSIQLLHHTADETTLRIHCGKGAYMRAIARDMGIKLRCFGHAKALHRRENGSFLESMMISLDILEKMVYKDIVLALMLPLRTGLDGILALEVDETSALRLKNGQKLAIPSGKGLQLGMILQIVLNGSLQGFADITERAVRPIRWLNTD